MPIGNHHDHATALPLNQAVILRHYSRRAGKLEAMAKDTGLKMLQKAVYRHLKGYVGVCLQRWCNKALDQAKVLRLPSQDRDLLP